MSRGPALTPLERMLKSFGDRIVARIDLQDKRLDTIEARLAQGQHENIEEVQGMFLELRTTMGETRDELNKLGDRVGKIERADDIAAGVAEALKERNDHDATLERGALTRRALKPPSWPTVAYVTGTAAVVGILANLHAAVLLAGRVAKAVWDTVVAKTG